MIQRFTTLAIALFMSFSLYAQTDVQPNNVTDQEVKDVTTNTLSEEVDKKEIVKTGYNFGPLPAVAYDADKGFQLGALLNIYDFGDGSTYPNTRQQWYFEASFFTKGSQLFVVSYDNRFLIPGVRWSTALTITNEKAMDFYGFNGYQSVYNQDFHKWKKDPDKMNVADYQSRAFYKYKRDLFRFAADVEGTIWKDIKWNAGLGVLGYMIDECNINMLNGKNK